MEPESQRLTWDLHGNVSGIECSQSLEYNVTARKNQYCQFPVLPSCGSKNYTVFVTGGQPFSTSIGYPEPEGNPGAAAQNLTCWVHDVDFLTCRWAVGSAAPRDVQYHLHVGEARTSEGRECPGYTADERGTHVRCRFDDLSGFSNRLYRFRVRGTSRASGIPCSEMFEQLSRIERLSPPNITGWCNKTYSLLEWEMSSRFSWKFTYELEIQQVMASPGWGPSFSKTRVPGAFGWIRRKKKKKKSSHVKRSCMLWANLPQKKKKIQNRRKGHSTSICCSSRQWIPTPRAPVERQAEPAWSTGPSCLLPRVLTARFLEMSLNHWTPPHPTPRPGS
uniref:Type I cytokine receptor cytokine-binding domain-containing protein n=1 Tax=Equus asinus asinus TaxID=83772 RepID=A0A8C4PPI8_EQUAS